MAKFKVVTGDCVQVLNDPKFRQQFDLVFGDPPFHIGQKYQDFDDSPKTRDEYRRWTITWVEACWAKCRGVMALHGPDDVASDYLYWEYVLGLKRIAWINWHYRFGQHNYNNWIDSRTHCLIYAKDPNDHTFNADAVLVQSDRESRYQDPRIADSPRGGKRLPFTVWGVPSDGSNWGRVQGNSNERRDNHPNQLPEVYLERIIRAYTNPGDYVLDPFCGSGTSATVAVALGRNALTIDISPRSAESARERIKKGAVRVKK